MLTGTFCLRIAASVLSSLVVLAGVSLAQGARGSIGGTIMDASGSVLVGVKVTVANAETGSSFESLSDEHGKYLAPQLLPGYYRVRAELAGFKQTQVERVQVNIDQAVALDLRLEVGQVTESVTIEGEALQLNTESGSVGHVVQNRQINDLPLNGRNAFDLVNLTPASFRIGGAVSVAGGRTMTASALLDGAFNSRGGLGQEGIEISPPIDSMQEFKVQANSMSSEFGRQRLECGPESPAAPQPVRRDLWRADSPQPKFLLLQLRWFPREPRRGAHAARADRVGTTGRFFPDYV